MAKSRSKNSRQAVKKSKPRAAAKSAATRSLATKAAAAAKKRKWVYAFGGGKAAGRAWMRDLLGGKGAGLAEMAHLGLPVPPGFTITTEVCTHFYANGKNYPKDLQPQVEAALAEIGRITGKKFGDGENPLLVSVRSGARASMPGMMDTVLNLGLNDTTVAALAEKSGDRRFAYDSYRRFITMYADVVLGIAHHHFEEILDEHKDRNGYTLDTDLEAADWEQLAALFKAARRAGNRQAVSAGPARAIVGRHRRGVRLVDEPARDHLSAPARHSGKLGHRRQRAGHGVRQYGRELGDRRCVYAQSLDRRDGSSTANSSSTRKARTLSPAFARRRRSPRRRARGRLRQALDGESAAAGFRRAQAHPGRCSKSTTATCRTSNSR